MEMEEQKKIERDLMSQEEFEKYLAEHSGLKTFESISRFRSVNRAIKRGHIAPNGLIIPKRPFNNRANTSKRRGVHSRDTNELKKQIYGQFKQYQRRVAQ